MGNKTIKHVIFLSKMKLWGLNQGLRELLSPPRVSAEGMKPCPEAVLTYPCVLSDVRELRFLDHGPLHRWGIITECVRKASKSVL